MNIRSTITVCAAVLYLLASSVAAHAQTGGNARYVNPFIGTDATGHTFPGATLPLGMVQVSPDTDFMGWDHCSGYHYRDTTLLGFSHTHLSGTGGKDLGDLLLMPFTNLPDTDIPRKRLVHASEQASPGYYAVELPDDQVQVALTATAHTAFHRYFFKRSSTGQLLIDLRHGLVRDRKALDNHVTESGLFFENDTTLSGFTRTKGWAGEKHVYFVIKLQQPYTAVRWLSDSGAGRNQRVVLGFRAGRPLQLQVKVALSTVSIENARANLVSENNSWSFGQVREKAVTAWDHYLSRINVTGSFREKQIFYTALYHSLIAPNNIADVNGEYRGPDNRVYRSATGHYYSTLSLWDTYRGLHPLYTILCPEVTSDIVTGMLAHFEHQGYLPVWTLWGHENFCMIANHAIPVVADAVLKGIGGIDVAKAWQAVKVSATVNHPHSSWDIYNRYGYLPSDIVTKEAVSTTLENAYDDWCVAAMAAKLGYREDHLYFLQRSLCYKNLYDSTVGFMRGRNANGQWVSGFDPYKLSHAGTAGGDYTEGNAWQYTWQVQHDTKGLAALMGQKQFIQKLDSFFSVSPKIEGEGSTLDITGLIGQYVHGNEPSHHVAYLYAMMGQAWKSQQRIHQIMNEMYSNTPDGLSGNDDCGQMSAWYVLSALGFYPVNPASGEYVFGRPSFKKAVIKTNGHRFTIEAKDLCDRNIFINKMFLNGKPYAENYLSHSNLVKGGKLTFIMNALHQ